MKLIDALKTLDKKGHIVIEHTQGEVLNISDMINNIEDEEDCNDYIISNGEIVEIDSDGYRIETNKYMII